MFCPYRTSWPTTQRNSNPFCWGGGGGWVYKYFLELHIMSLPSMGYYWLPLFKRKLDQLLKNPSKLAFSDRPVKFLIGVSV